jgi:hypothetical protein
LAIGTRIAARHARLFVAGFRLLRAASGHKGRTPTHWRQRARLRWRRKSWRRDQLPLLSLDELLNGEANRITRKHNKAIIAG